MIPRSASLREIGRVWSLVALSLAGTTPLLSAGCKGGGSDDGNGSGGSTSSVSCSEAVQEASNVFGPVPIPEDCGTMLEGSHTATPRDGYRDPADPFSLQVSFVDGTLSEVDGIACEPVSPGNVTAPSFAPFCGQRFLCDCCVFGLRREMFATRSGPEIARWILQAPSTVDGERCGPDQPSEGTKYYVDGYYDSGSGGTTGGGGTSNGGTSGSACSDCLANCQGLPSCCTGTGCSCESACRPSSDCIGTQVYCCGPGSCFCTSDCPY